MATVKLQGIYERRNAIPAAELKPGMVTVWNFGYTETVKSVEPSLLNVLPVKSSKLYAVIPFLKAIFQSPLYVYTYLRIL